MEMSVSHAISANQSRRAECFRIREHGLSNYSCHLLPDKRRIRPRLTDQSLYLEKAHPFLILHKESQSQPATLHAIQPNPTQHSLDMQPKASVESDPRFPHLSLSLRSEIEVFGL